MANVPANDMSDGRERTLPGERSRIRPHRTNKRCQQFPFLAALLLLATVIFAQEGPRVSAIEPLSGKVDDTVAVTGENLGKGQVASILLSDDKADYSATMVEQTAQKIVMKVPKVKPGDYNVSIQVGNNIFIQPLRFTVQE